MSARTINPRHSPVVNLRDSNRGRFTIVRRIPTLMGDPEWVVAEGETRAEAVGFFFSQMDAEQYADWKNQKDQT